MTLQLLHSEFPYIWGKLYLLICVPFSHIFTPIFSMFRSRSTHASIHVIYVLPRTYCTIQHIYLNGCTYVHYSKILVCYIHILLILSFCNSSCTWWIFPCLFAETLVEYLHFERLYVWHCFIFAYGIYYYHFQTPNSERDSIMAYAVKSSFETSLQIYL
jgi:hypothetical protein